MSEQSRIYHYDDLQVMAECAADAAKKPIKNGISIYVDTDPDVGGHDMFIDPQDTKGIEIFRQFAIQLSNHFTTLK